MAMMRRMTYKNLMAVIHKLERKGYGFDEAEQLARGIFAEFEARPMGMSIERRTELVLPKGEEGG